MKRSQTKNTTQLTNASKRQQKQVYVDNVTHHVPNVPANCWDKPPPVAGLSSPPLRTSLLLKSMTGGTKELPFRGVGGGGEVCPLLLFSPNPGPTRRPVNKLESSSFVRPCKMAGCKAGVVGKDFTATGLAGDIPVGVPEVYIFECKQKHDNNPTAYEQRSNAITS